MTTTKGETATKRPPHERRRTALQTPAWLPSEQGRSNEKRLERASLEVCEGQGMSKIAEEEITETFEPSCSCSETDNENLRSLILLE